VSRVEVRQYLRLEPAAPVIHASNGWLCSLADGATAI